MAKGKKTHYNLKSSNNSVPTILAYPKKAINFALLFFQTKQLAE